MAEWRSENRDRYNERQRARARSRALGHNVESVEYAEIIRLDPCVYCGRSGGTVEHIRPKAAGGGNEPENLAGACGSCNASKNDKPLLIFLLDRMVA